MKASPNGHLPNAAATQCGIRNLNPIDNLLKEKPLMSSKKQPVVRKASKKLAKTPVVRLRDAATQDSDAIRFGNGSAPAILRK